jgi:4-alpha-glucanotransferase
MNFPRASGILLHPTSLPSKFGIGDLGDEAYRFVDFLADARQTYWQVLPLGPTGFGDSPYQCFSAFAGNANLISPEKIVEDGFLTIEEINETPKFPVGKVDFGKVYKWKNQILAKAYERFRLTTSVDLRGKFETFSQEQAAWLDDYALFRAVKKTQNQASWQNWDAALKLRDEKALAKAREDLREEIQTQKFQQWLFFRQWNELKITAARKTSESSATYRFSSRSNSADVWCNPSQFKLKRRRFTDGCRRRSA